MLLNGKSQMFYEDREDFTTSNRGRQETASVDSKHLSPILYFFPLSGAGPAFSRHSG